MEVVMETGAINSYIDVAQVTLYAFWVFFAGLIFYLRREDKREGSPLETESAGRIKTSLGFPAFPGIKVFKTAHGPRIAPSPANERKDVALAPVAPWPGAPLEPTGNPMLDGVGPAAWANREDKPELSDAGLPLIVPMRTTPAIAIEDEDPDPRGMRVIAGDHKVAGKVVDVWVDRAEMLIRYLEVAVEGAAGRHVLVPVTMARVNVPTGAVTVRSVFARHFADVPGTARPDQVTKLEEDKISAYFAGGTLYASPDRMGPLL
jgi:photosynthetic reaction center H subunit